MADAGVGLSVGMRVLLLLDMMPRYCSTTVVCNVLYSIPTTGSTSSYSLHSFASLLAWQLCLTLALSCSYRSVGPSVLRHRSAAPAWRRSASASDPFVQAASRQAAKLNTCTAANANKLCKEQQWKQP